MFYIFRSSLDSTKKPLRAEPKLIREMETGCDGFVVNWVEDRVYFAEYSAISGLSRIQILSMDLEGNNVTEVMSRLGDAVSVKRMAIDPYRR